MGVLGSNARCGMVWLQMRTYTLGMVPGLAALAKQVCARRSLIRPHRSCRAGGPLDRVELPLAINVSHVIRLYMLEVRQTAAYAKWFLALRDRAAMTRIDIRIRRLSLGNPGDVRPLGQGISELRIDHGPGYRVYFMQKAEVFIVLLAGGDKSSQDADIRSAKALAAELDG